MSEARKLEPILTKVSDEEIKAIMDEASEALEKGVDDETYFAILKRAPILPEQADIIKKFYADGLQSMIEDGVNFSKVVEAYGEEWFTE